jgi:hypothetical protein
MHDHCLSPPHFALFVRSHAADVVQVVSQSAWPDWQAALVGVHVPAPLQVPGLLLIVHAAVDAL